MFEIYRTMCVTFHEPLFQFIHLEVDVKARTAHVSVPGVLETTLGPIKRKVTGALHRARIDLLFGKEFSLAEVASGTTGATGKVPLHFANTRGHRVHKRLTSHGVAR